MLKSLQDKAVPALVPLNVTVLEPWVAPKLLPFMVTGALTSPEVGEILSIVGTRTKCASGKYGAEPVVTVPICVNTPVVVLYENPVTDPLPQLDT